MGIAVYYFFATLVFLLAGPFLLLNPKARWGVAQKLGIVPDEIKNRAPVVAENGAEIKPVWFDAVSVGEFNAALPLIRLFRKKHPEIPIFISTTTGAGNKLAREKAGDWATIFYRPLDLPWSASNFLDAINPQLVVITETEVWPGFNWQCHKRSVPLVLVNGRVSPKSFRSYYGLRFFFGSMFRNFTAIAAQSENEVSRYLQIAGPGLNVIPVGNLKFDGLSAIDDSEQTKLRESLNISPRAAVIVAGSTHEGEEQAVLEAITRINKKLKRDSQATSSPGIASDSGNPGSFANECMEPILAARLIIAPRHPERFARVKEIVEAAGYRPRLASLKQKFEADNDVYILDTIGHLMRHYSLATAAFVGGTIARIGGHNLLEPYVYKTPVVCGPNVFKTRDVAYALVERKAIFLIAKGADVTEELTKGLDEILRSGCDRQRMGLAGYEYWRASQGAVARTLEVLESQRGH